ncbi:gamma-aminobutyric acid type B receptor subunit 2-like isoform X2 [Dendronephthya gigantea]|nr:gamma-aminobutyric acid type B receptor subunit 2-like isoform X2 [Dendronephthya gigantea]XP_028399765.1 gamma-aminobutyric acid type B receptor subunit 2-like isoform X2 [Dendronephthya gigantea]XP_028399767.1 gamma-aminobutyric acid type B receptor subunit 2-like isoform X2 [Dendronephthya gigantea]
MTRRKSFYLAFGLFLLTFLARSSLCVKKNVTIPVLAPLMNFNSDRYAYGVAARYAFELINKRTDILKDYHLVPEIHDTIGNIAKALHVMHKIIDASKCEGGHSLPPAIIGPSFSKTSIATARSITFFYILQYTYGATSPILDSHHDFPFLVRTFPGTSMFSEGHAALMKRFGWKRAGILYDHHEEDGIFNKITENLMEKLRAHNITVAGVESVDAGASEHKTSDAEIRERLERLKAADIKIYFAQFTHVRAYRIFCQAFKLGMFGKNYVWIVHPQVESVDKWIRSEITTTGLNRECSESDFKLVSERMFHFYQQEFRNDDKKTESGLTAEEYIDYIEKHRLRNEKTFISSFEGHGYIFDTIWNMALTLNKSIPELKKLNISLEKMPASGLGSIGILTKTAHNIEFEGITGKVKLNQPRGRIGVLTLFQIRDKKSHKVGSYQGTTGKLDVIKDDEYLWIDGHVPSDRSLERTAILNIPIPLYLPLCLVAGLGIILAIGVLIFNIYHRNERYIRKSAPLFNNIIIVGIMMCLSTVAFFGFPVELGDKDKFLLMCKLRTWILCIGFSLSFGSMFVKTWRVYKIFTNRKLKYSIERLSNISLIGMVVLIVALDIFIILLWQFIDPMVVKMHSMPKEVDPDDPNSVLLPVLYTCHSPNQDKWVTTIYVIKGILLLYGLFLAYETRNVQFEHLNDSRMIGVCVYNCGVMSVLGGLLGVILNESYYKESYGITAICIIFPSLGTLFLIFLPKGKRLILGIDLTPNGYARVVRFVKRDTHGSETETTDGVVIEGPGARNNFHLRKDSVCSEGVTSVSSSIPCTNKMPIYEENGQAAVSPTSGSYASESSA